jgi:hypothetical protein
MAKSKNASISTVALNAGVLAAKATRRFVKASYSVEYKMETVQKLRDTTRDLRSNSKVVKHGSVIKKTDG